MEAVAILIFLFCLIVFVLGIVGLFKPLTRLKMPSRLAALGWILGGFVGMAAAAINAPPSEKAAGNSQPESAEVADKDPNPAKTVEPPLPPPPPEHLYASIDGDDYLYSAGISDDARDAGQVAGQFLAFRYRGTNDGKITLSSDGMTLRCDVDCNVITMTGPYGTKEHLEYNPSSVAGAAFTDAMNGLLMERPSKKPKGDSK